jgi:hypothetical protein
MPEPGAARRILSIAKNRAGCEEHLDSAGREVMPD